jgi:two-component system alkaline phosphatase synthesis response regulator PhoP
MKVLICEDEPSLSNALAEKLGKYGVEIRVAPDGESALQIAREFIPNIILLDLVLPKKDGFTVLKELRQDESLKDVNVVVVSNLAEDSDIKRTLDMGAKDYFVKSQHTINEIVERALGFLPPK